MPVAPDSDLSGATLVLAGSEFRIQMTGPRADTKVTGRCVRERIGHNTPVLHNSLHWSVRLRFPLHPLAGEGLHAPHAGPTFPHAP